LNPSGRRKAIILLLMVTVISSTWLLYSTIKYVEFFNALTNLELQIEGIDFVTTQDSLNVTVEMETINPTGYGDLLLNGMSGTVNYEGDLHTITISSGGPRGGTPYQVIETNLWQLPDGHVSPIRPIQVYSYATDHFTMNIRAQDETARAFNDYYYRTSAPPEIIWHISLRVSITTPTFLKTMELQYDFIY
jgi:hypothetical protein